MHWLAAEVRILRKLVDKLMIREESVDKFEWNVSAEEFVPKETDLKRGIQKKKKVRFESGIPELDGFFEDMFKICERQEGLFGENMKSFSETGKSIDARQEAYFKLEALMEEHGDLDGLYGEIMKSWEDGYRKTYPEKGDHSQL